MAPVVSRPGVDPVGRSRRSRSGLRAVALVLLATAFPVASLVWAAEVARTEVERRALAGLAATAKATVLQEQQAWDDAVRVAVSAASRPVPLSALELRDTTLAGQGVQNILITGPFADVRLYSAFGDVVAMAAHPGVTPTPVGAVAPGVVTFGDPVSVGPVVARQVSVPAGIGGIGRLVVDVDMTQLLGKPSDLGFGRTGAKFLVTREGLIIAGSDAVGTHLLAPANIEIAAAGKPVTKTLFSPTFGRQIVESYEPVPGQNVGILVQQARSEVMAGADRLSALLRWVAFVVGVLGAALAAFLGVFLSRRSRRLATANEEVQFLSAITANMSEGVVMVRATDSTIAYANTSYEAMFGFGAGELVGRPITDLIAPGPAPPDRTISEVRDALATEGTWRGEIHSRRKDGSAFWCALNVTEFDHPSFGPAWIGVNTDITARRHAEEGQANLASIVQVSRDAIFAKGLDGIVTSWNHGAEMLFGYTAAEMVGSPIDLLVPPDRRNEEEELRGRVARGLGVEQQESVRLRKDGTLVDVSFTLSPIADGAGEITGIATICRDVTARNRAEAALLEREAELAMARDQALEASRLKSDFLANMSHEIRTPMNAVIGLTGLLLDSTLSGEQREYLGAVRSAGEALLEIINDLLDFSKIEAGKLRLEVMDFELCTVIDEVSDLLSADANEKGLELSTFVDPDAPAFVRGDPGRLRQVLTNLVGNAIKFSDHGEVAVRAHAGAVTPGATDLRFEVIDTGIGIPLEAQRHLFQAFEQVDSSASRRHGGTGLGLAISKQLIEMMGGRIGLESRLGGGSTFWFEVPLAVASTPQPKVVDRPDPLAHRREDGARLLVAEDNPVNQLVAVRMLEKLGYRADVAANGSEAVDALMRIDYAAVLMDCQMPEMDGFEATREIRRRQSLGRRTPVIAMTAAAAEEDRERCFQADMDDYISKPVRTEDLGVVLAKWVPAERVSLVPHPAG
jgi:PAS domain S-box-containing protein